MQDDEVISAGPDYWMPYNMEPVHMAITADGMPVTPPSSWFNDPQLTRPTALVVEPNGHVYGHIACWETKHIGMPGAIKPPRSKTNYAFFATGAVQTAEGAHVNVGQITLVGGHAPIDVDVPRAVAHYDDTDSAVCDVAIGEDRYGIWVAGALRPDVDDVKIRQLRASAVSGDWRPINGNLELVAVCSVNVPGFPIPRARVASGQTLALVAAGIEPLVEDRLRAYGGHSEVDIDGVLMALAARVERLEAWMLALVDPNETTALGRESYDDWDDEDEYKHDYGHHDKCGCGMCGGYGKKRKKMGMYAAGISSKDIEQNVTAAGGGTDVESLRRRVHAPMIASLRERVHGTESTAAALRARVHGDEALTAATRPWNKNLHPRGKDGQFIEKLGFVKFASGIGRKQDKGKVIGVKKGKNKDGMILSVEKSDGTIVEKMPSEVSSTAAPKAFFKEMTPEEKKFESELAVKRSMAKTDTRFVDVKNKLNQPKTSTSKKLAVGDKISLTRTETPMGLPDGSVNPKDQWKEGSKGTIVDESNDFYTVRMSTYRNGTNELLVSKKDASKTLAARDEASTPAPAKTDLQETVNDLKNKIDSGSVRSLDEEEQGMFAELLDKLSNELGFEDGPPLEPDTEPVAENLVRRLNETAMDTGDVEGAIDKIFTDDPQLARQITDDDLDSIRDTEGPDVASMIADRMNKALGNFREDQEDDADFGLDTQQQSNVTKLAKMRGMDYQLNDVNQAIQLAPEANEKDRADLIDNLLTWFEYESESYDTDEISGVLDTLSELLAQTDSAKYSQEIEVIDDLLNRNENKS